MDGTWLFNELTVITSFGEGCLPSTAESDYIWHSSEVDLDLSAVVLEHCLKVCFVIGVIYWTCFLGVFLIWWIIKGNDTSFFFFFEFRFQTGSLQVDLSQWVFSSFSLSVNFLVMSHIGCAQLPRVLSSTPAFVRHGFCVVCLIVSRVSNYCGDAMSTFCLFCSFFPNLQRLNIYLVFFPLRAKMA